MTMDEITADDIIQEHREQDIIQSFIDADSTDEDIELVVRLVDAGLSKHQVAQALLSMTRRIQ